MKTVNWAFHTSHIPYIDSPECAKDIVVEPYSLLSAEALNERRGVTFIKCPAVTDFMKTTYVFKSPMDLTINIEVTDTVSKIYCDDISQEFFDNMFDMRFLEDGAKGISPYPLIGIDFLNTFTCDTSVLLQAFPAFMHYNDFTYKTTIIPGEYDISKWVRPVELVFEVKNKKERIEIKKGDALAYFKFNADETVKLNSSPTPWDEIVTCNNIRNTDTFRPLKERYKSYKDYKDGKS